MTELKYRKIQSFLGGGKKWLPWKIVLKGPRTGENKFNSSMQDGTKNQTQARSEARFLTPT